MGHASYCQDRNEHSGKKRGGGLIIYLNNNWCINGRIIANHCSPDPEALSILFSPSYLPHEISSVTITAVYVPASANFSSALSHVLTMVSEQHQSHPEDIHIVAGDFNQACLKSVLPSFMQHVNCATRGNNRLGVFKHLSSRSVRPSVTVTGTSIHPAPEKNKTVHQGYYNLARKCPLPTPRLF